MNISVILPCHNCGPWIQDALRSIVKQTYPAQEIIVVDDASTDDSVVQIKASGMPVKLLQTNFGNAAAARNFGVEQAAADWVAFLDADDIWYPHHLRQAVSLLESGSDVAYLAHNDQLRCDIDPKGVLVTRETHPPVEVPSPGLSDHSFFTWWAQYSWFCTCTLVFRKDVFLSCGGFDPTQKRRHDFEMFLRLIHGRTWAYNPVAGMAYRFQINPNCVSGNIVETSYYTLRGLLKNRSLYDGPVMEQAIRKWAWRTAKYVVLSQNREESQAAWDLCCPHLGLEWKWLFATARRYPLLVSTARHLKKSLVRA